MANYGAPNTFTPNASAEVDAIAAGFSAVSFGTHDSADAGQAVGFKPVNFGQAYLLVDTSSRAKGFKVTKFGMAGNLPSYNPIKTNWIGAAAGFKPIQFGAHT